MRDKPSSYPDRQPDDNSLKSLPEIVLNRRSTNSFDSDPVPDRYLKAILELGTQAPSGYNLQPWRFLVVQDQGNREKLKKAAFGQNKVGEAPVVIIALGMKEAWKNQASHVFEEGAARGAGSPEAVEESKDGAFKFLSSQNMPVWVTRHTMIPFTYMMLIAESFGFDTAPMEGFDPAAVKKEFGIPDEAEVVGLLAIGHRKGEEKVYPGRFSLEDLAFSEEWGRPWKG